MNFYKKLIQDNEAKRFYMYNDFRDTLFLFFAKPLSIFFFKLNLNATFITFLSGACSIFGSILLTLNDPIILFIAMFFFIAFYLLDYCDGIVARLRNEQCVGGRYLDLIMHIVTPLSFAVGISFGSINIDGINFYPFAILSIIASALSLSRFSIGWMSIACQLCEDNKLNQENKSFNLNTNTKKPLFIKVFIRLGSLIFHEDYFIFTVPILLFLNLFFKDYLFVDIRTMIVIYGALVYFPAMIIDTFFYSKFKINNIMIKFNSNEFDQILPDFIYFKDN